MLEIIKNFSSLKNSPDLLFTYPLVFPEEMNFFFFYSILLLFSRYSLPYVQFEPLSPKFSQMSAAFSFSNEVRWRRTWVEQCWLIQNCFWVWLSVTPATPDFKWSWNLIEGMLISDTLQHTCNFVKKTLLQSPRTVTCLFLYWKVFICNKVMTGQRLLSQRAPTLLVHGAADRHAHSCSETHCPLLDNGFRQTMEGTF